MTATVVGVLTGVVVIAVEYLVEELLHEVREASPRVIAVALVAGAEVAALLVYFGGGRSKAQVTGLSGCPIADPIYLLLDNGKPVLASIGT